MSKSLFEEFNPVSSKEWKQKIQVDLKGADYNDTLIWNTNEGIDVKPFYHTDEFSSFPETSGTESTAWHIGQAINVDDAKAANAKALDAINRGAESIIFNINAETINAKTLLNGIKVPVYVNTSFLSSEYLKTIYDAVENPSPITYNADIIGHLAKTGNWHNNLKHDHKQFEEITSQTNQLVINVSLYQNAGATSVQQLAYAMAHANEYLNHLDTVIASETKQSLDITFQVSVSGNYFFEIAKLKALRNLWATLALEYNVNTACKIIATPSRRNKTIYDYNVNMLRTTTECMSAILGGANVVHNLPYNALFEEPTEFGERISRNQLLILKNESYFNAVNNPTDGTYYIESLTQQLSEKALAIFKDIEANGGFLHQLKEGIIQRKIKESAAKEQADFNDGKLVLLGTNKHPNTNDSMKGQLEKQPFMTIEKRKTLIEPIITKRLSEQLELDRLSNE